LCHQQEPQDHPQNTINGESFESIQGVKLPTTRQILQYNLYLKEISLPNCPIYGLIKQAVKVVFWHMAGIKIILQQSAKKKLESIWQMFVDAVKKPTV